MKQLTVDGKEVNIYGMDDFKLSPKGEHSVKLYGERTL
jgi:hypothetical protein